MRRIVGLFLAFLLCGCVLVFSQDKQEKKGVSKEALQAHLAALQQGRDQALANYNAILGAIQLCQDLLAELNAAEKADNTKAAAKADPPLAQAEKNSKPAEKPDPPVPSKPKPEKKE
jgi:outer membrane biosynthesis protein TonB